MWFYVSWNTFHSESLANCDRKHAAVFHEGNMYENAPAAGCKIKSFQVPMWLPNPAQCCLVILILSMGSCNSMIFGSKHHAPGHGYGGWWVFQSQLLKSLKPTVPRPPWAPPWLQTLRCLRFGRGYKARVAGNTSVHASRLMTPTTGGWKKSCISKRMVESL